jgi:hypothetical protein
MNFTLVVVMLEQKGNRVMKLKLKIKIKTKIYQKPVISEQREKELPYRLAS